MTDFRWCTWYVMVLAGSHLAAAPRLRYIIRPTLDFAQIRFEMQAEGEGASRSTTLASAAIPMRSGEFQQLRINSQYFYILGDHGFPLPNWPDTRAIRCEIQWAGFPPSWLIVDSYGVAHGAQRFATTMGDLRKAVFVGGDFRIRPVSKAAPGLRLVTRGVWQFPDAAITKLLDRLYGADVAIWRDAGFKDHFVWMLPTPDSGPHEGENRTQGLIFYGGAETEDIRDFAFLLSHELFHAWNPHRLTTPAFDERLYWFTEGVTDFYAAVALVRAGIWDFEQFVSKFNAVSREYYDSPKRNLTADEMVVQRRTNLAAERLPYQQGFLLSANWNLRIRERSRGAESLDSALRQLKGASGEVLTSDRIIRALTAAGVPESGVEIEKSILRGKTIDLVPNVLGDCATETIADAGFDIGFDYEKSGEANRVVNLKLDSAAYDAGMREGQTILSRDVVLGDPGYQAKLEIRDERGQRWIIFYPISRNRAAIPQFRPDQTGESCTEIFR
jgi:predicted metalloprotease with PDZ domain